MSNNPTVEDLRKQECQYREKRNNECWQQCINSQPGAQNATWSDVRPDAPPGSIGKALYECGWVSCQAKYPPCSGPF